MYMFAKHKGTTNYFPYATLSFILTNELPWPSVVDGVCTVVVEHRKACVNK